MVCRLSIYVGAALLWGAVALAGTPADAPAKPETPFETAMRLSVSETAKDRAAALEILRGLKGTRHIEKERALWLYGRVALSLRKDWPDGRKEARAAFEELAEKALFDFMPWRGEIGKWEVRLAEARDGLAAKTLAEDKFKAELSALDDEVDRALGRQNEREYAVNVAWRPTPGPSTPAWPNWWSVI